MYKHHEDSINNLIQYFNKDNDVISVILGGSIAKGCERFDSDVDAIIVVTERKYKELSEENRLSECISGYCTYPKGYFDIKYFTKAYLMAVAQKGSEPSRNAFIAAKCLYTKDEEIDSIISRIPIFQKNDKKEKLLSFYSALTLNYGYFWESSENDIYLRTKTAADIVLFGFRLLLQDNEMLFPCHKSLLRVVSLLQNKPENIIKKSELFLQRLDDETKEDFVNSILNFIDYNPPKDFSNVLTRYVDDNELWWYKNRPVLAEW